VVLGHFGKAGLLGGEFKLDEARARKALSNLAAEMSKAAGRKVSAESAAQGVLDVVNANMERALRRISVERGYDPRDFVLLPFGGAGGLHAVDLARSLRIPTIISPTAGGALSAIGVLAADVVKDQSRTVMLEVSPDIDSELEAVFCELENSNRTSLLNEGFPDTSQQHTRSLAARYKGQSFELELQQTSGDIAAAFHRAHLKRYGYAQTGDVVEIVGARLRSGGLVRPLQQKKLKKPATKIDNSPSYVETIIEGKARRVVLYRREDLAAGFGLRTPCLVTEYSSTTLIPDGTQARVDGYGNLIITAS
jgi:N-methylhydantoinase A